MGSHSNSSGDDQPEALVRGQVQIWKLMFGFAESMALKSAVQLGVADIIHSHGSPVTLSQLASGIDSPSPDSSYLSRIMRFLVHKGLFTAHHTPRKLDHDDVDDAYETRYGLNDVSRWLLRSSELNLGPMVLMENHPQLLAPWHQLGPCVREGGLAFEKAHGSDIWGLGSRDPELNRVFNDGLASTAKVVMKAFLSGYGDGLGGVGSLVDVGGGMGGNLAEIVRAHPHVRGINFDLPHVVGTAPEYEGVEHVGGDMFQEIPQADAVLMKWILHDWEDDKCVEILNKCRKAIPERRGKVIIVEIVLPEDDEKEESGGFGEVGLVFDLLMIAHTAGKERTERQWKVLLEKGGFPRYRVIRIPALPAIIEAYPV
ncbi:unnamed protein product [Linum tenue]|uniref:Uncharacterized protein n=1 Tax=Linum tenue TaxID=586396 RepID=A0AAV0QX73_9ROSI|nr:unnamed protein product [Linum tenue]